MQIFFAWRVLAIGFLFALCGLAFGASDPPVPGAFQSQGQANKDAAHPYEQTQVLQVGSESAPVFVKVIPAPLSEMESKKNQYEGEEKPNLDRGITLATIVMTFINLGMLVYTFRLWRDSRANYQKTLSQMRSSTHSQLRAYIGPDGAFYSVKKTKEGKLVGQIHIRIKNFGSTPAAEVSGKTLHFIQSTQEDPVENWPEKSSLTPGHGFGRVEPNLILPMTIDIEDALPLNETRLNVRAIIQYSDAFNRTYKRSFSFYLPTGSINDESNSSELHIKPYKNYEEEINEKSLPA